MKSKSFFKKILVVYFIFFTSFSFTYADPSVPPPPPPVTSYTYTLMDEFRSCGPDDGVANFCDAYYARQKIVTNSGVITVNQLDYVCGKDVRCTTGQPCYITNPIDNYAWRAIGLSKNWECPDGFGLAHMHSPGTLDPNFNTVSFSADSLRDGAVAFRSNSSVDLYFNAYIPACVNRIPMMNFNSYLKDSSGNTYSKKTGLYAKHETLDYDASPTGGVLENFKIPGQDEFRVTYDLYSNLKTYRMWSFRERFVGGLLNTVAGKNLRIPGDINVDLLSPDRSHDFEGIYFSSDYMMGAYSADNINNVPVGEDLTQELTSICNFDVNDLNIWYIDDATDLKDAINDPNKKSEVISVLNIDKNICNLDMESTATDIEFIEELDGWDKDNYDKIVTFDIKDIKWWNYDNALEFENWAYDNKATLSKELRNDGILSYDPKEEIKVINNIDLTVVNEDLILKASDFGYDNSTEFLNYINDTIDPWDYDWFSEDLENEGYVNWMYLIKDIRSLEIVNNDKVKMNADIYTRDVTMNLNIDSVVYYNGLASTEITFEYETTTESTWNWRSLQDLTLTDLAKCLYNWDSCLFNSKTEPSVSWQMSEVADLGYGPRYNSLAYIWSEQSLESEYDLEYGYHFDGARGSNDVVTAISVYKECGSNESWISSEGYYACSDGSIFKCYYGLSLDEYELGFIFHANLGDTISHSIGRGFVCVNTTSGYQFREVNCFDNTNVIS